MMPVAHARNPSFLRQNAQTDIPKGTLWAILVSTIVYILMAIAAGSCAARDATGIILVNALNMSTNATSAYLTCSRDT